MAGHRPAADTASRRHCVSWDRSMLRPAPPMRSLTSRLMARIGALSLVLFALGLGIVLELSIREAWSRTERSFAASLQSVSGAAAEALWTDRKSTRLNSSH